MHEHRDLVTVVIIFLNEARFLEEAIASVYEQTYPLWELMLVDDGSSDGSSDIAKRYAARDPQRVRYLDHPDHDNLGMSASRNVGASCGRGEFIAFLDGDDIWLPSRLERSVALMRQHPSVALVYGASEYWRSWEPRAAAGSDKIQPHGFRVNRIIPAPKLLVRFWSHRASLPCVNSILVRRKVFDEVGGYESSFRGMWEDQVFLVKVCLQHAVYVSDECWDRYRQHVESCCAQAEASGSLFMKHRAFLDWSEDYLVRNGWRDTHVWRALRTEQRHAVRPRRSFRGRVERLLHRLRRSPYLFTEWMTRLRNNHPYGRSKRDSSNRAPSAGPCEPSGFPDPRERHSASFSTTPQS